MALRKEVVMIEGATEIERDKWKNDCKLASFFTDAVSVG